MNAVFLSIITGVVVAVEVGRHAGIFGEQFGDGAVVPKVVNIGWMHGEMAEEHDTFLCFRGRF